MSEENGTDTPRLFDGRRKEWFSVDNIIVDEYLPRIGDKAFSLYCYLSRKADNGSGKSFPRQSEIERMFGWSNSTVRRALKTLIDEGLVKRVPRFRDTDGGQMANDYYLVDVQSPESTPLPTDEQGAAPEWTGNIKTQTTKPIQKDEKETPNGVSKEPAPRQRSSSTLKAKGLSQADAMDRVLAFYGDHPLGSYMDQLVKAAADENVTGEIAWTRIYREFITRFKSAESKNKGITQEAWEYGFEQAIAKPAPNIGYVKKAAESYRPNGNKRNGKTSLQGTSVGKSREQLQREMEEF